MTALRVLIVDDDDLMRAGLRAILSTDESIDVVGEACDGREGVHRARRLEPDVVLMDVRMPRLDGIAATRQIVGAVPETRVLILTTFDDDDYVFGALRAGASGFLLKRTPPEQFVAAIQTIAAGESLLSPEVTRTVIDGIARQPQPDHSPIRLPVGVCASSHHGNATCWGSSRTGCPTPRSPPRWLWKSRPSRRTSSASWPSLTCATACKP